MFVLGNVIKPQGLEPLQFSTKFRAPSEEATVTHSVSNLHEAQTVIVGVEEVDPGSWTVS